MKSIINFFTKPKISATLIDASHAKVLFRNVTAEETMIILFAIIDKTSKALGMQDHRQLMNKIIDLDKTIVRAKKQEKSAKKYQK